MHGVLKSMQGSHLVYSNKHTTEELHYCKVEVEPISSDTLYIKGAPSSTFLTKKYGDVREWWNSSSVSKICMVENNMNEQLYSYVEAFNVG